MNYPIDRGGAAHDYLLKAEAFGALTLIARPISFKQIPYAALDESDARDTDHRDIKTTKPTAKYATTSCISSI
jgi:hypothetical protein